MEYNNWFTYHFFRVVSSGHLSRFEHISISKIIVTNRLSTLKRADRKVMSILEYYTYFNVVTYIRDIKYDWYIRTVFSYLSQF